MPHGRLYSQSMKIDYKTLDNLIASALAEDIGTGDVTTAALIHSKSRGRGLLVARERGVLAGMPVVKRLAQKFDGRLKITHALPDGSVLSRGTVIAEIRGPVASILTIERALLNFLQYLSGIATFTRKYVDAVAGTGVAILDTRKTLPGWRNLAKYAVRVGGGRNHRLGLYDQILIKDNHLALAKLTPAEAVRLARAKSKRLRIEVEVENIADARDAALAGADIIMLDNLAPAAMKRAAAAIRAVNPLIIIEASGGITLKTVRIVARTGVDWISVGALTHSAPSIDIALDIVGR